MKTPSFSPFAARASLADLSGLSGSLPLQELQAFMQELQKWQEKLNLTGGGFTGGEEAFARKDAEKGRRGKKKTQPHMNTHVGNWKPGPLFLKPSGSVIF